MAREFVKGLASIIVPVYNVEPYLRECLDSIINQTYQNLEIIVVDNESTDGGGAICDEYAQKDPRVRVIHRPHGCVVSFPRNTGIEAATGEYCFFVDSDDWLDLQTVERCIQSFEQYPDINIISFRVSFWVLNQDEKTWRPDYYVPRYVEKRTYYGKGVLDAFVGSELLPAPWQRAYRTRLIQDMRFIEQAGIVEDGPFLLELCQKLDIGLLTLPYDCYNYRSFRPGALTNKKAYIWEGSLIGIKQVLGRPTFLSLSRGVKGASILLVAAYLRQYLQEFYVWSQPSLPMTSEEERFYHLLLSYQNFIAQHRALLPWSVDGFIARVMISCPPEKVMPKVGWIEKFVRIFRLDSKLYADRQV